MAACLSGKSALKPLCDALGIKGPVKRIVIDCDIRSAVVAYVQRFVRDDDLVSIGETFAKLQDAVEVREVERVSVDEKGNVTNG